MAELRRRAATAITAFRASPFAAPPLPPLSLPPEIEGLCSRPYQRVAVAMLFGRYRRHQRALPGLCSSRIGLPRSREDVESALPLFPEGTSWFADWLHTAADEEQIGRIVRIATVKLLSDMLRDSVPLPRTEEQRRMLVEGALRPQRISRFLAERTIEQLNELRARSTEVGVHLNGACRVSLFARA